MDPRATAMRLARTRETFICRGGPPFGCTYSSSSFADHVGGSDRFQCLSTWNGFKKLPFSAIAIFDTFFASVQTLAPDSSVTVTGDDDTFPEIVDQ